MFEILGTSRVCFSLLSLYFTDCLAGGVDITAGDLMNEKSYFQHQFIQSLDEIVITTSWVNTSKLSIEDNNLLSPTLSAEGYIFFVISTRP